MLGELLLELLPTFNYIVHNPLSCASLRCGTVSPSFSRNARNNMTLNEATKILGWHVLFLGVLEEFRRVSEDNCACSASMSPKWLLIFVLCLEFT